MAPTSYNIALVGAAGSGKTMYMNRLKGKTFNGRWNPSYGRKDSTLELNTNYGPIRITFNEYAGLDYHSIPTLLANTDAVIYMYDVSSVVSLKFLNKMKTHFSGIPSLLVANKVDINPEDHKVIGEPQKPTDIEYTRISCKKGENFTDPIITLLKKLSGEPDMAIV
jgi:GTPase SAR1 family protein